ncbi:hypothetical protein [Streptomyces sp. HGB0020]|uniref:hypothetical protein n=1 Tax=Streptomyces sp. HGB0020 TaxID=1078086 RepID=UPI00034E5026|nr:hypothetical protein [Streptomyces sp. HGB0020]EPD63178.1 hypothetical protein HMPREF1211_03519 [Streptomyces sp. HGB0020]
MEPTTYVSQAGALQQVASPQVAERLRAAGWRPYAELAALADTDDVAREHLERAKDYQAERLAEQEAREARYAPATRPQPQAAEEPAEEPAEAETPARKRRAAARS